MPATATASKSQAQRATDLLTNPRFVDFRERLERRGATLRLLWSAKTGRNPSGRGYDDMGLFSVQMNIGRPASATIIIQDYGERDGFGIWLEAKHNDIDGTVEEILASDARAALAKARGEG